MKQISRLYLAIAKVTTRYTFKEPVTSEDLAHIGRELEVGLPKGHHVWLEHRPGVVSVRVAWPDNRPLYESNLLTVR